MPYMILLMFFSKLSVEDHEDDCAVAFEQYAIING